MLQESQENQHPVIPETAVIPEQPKADLPSMVDLDTLEEDLDAIDAELAAQPDSA